MTVPPTRIIARLDIKGQNVIKGIHLEGLRVIGKPGPIARQYYDQGIDEFVYMDVVASLYGRNGILETIEEAARDIFVPLTVGGGVRNKDDIVAALRSGADKVAINTAAISNPSFIKEAAESFGSQCIVLSVEAKNRGPGQWEALTDNGREQTGVSVLDWVKQAQELGAGEVLLTSVDKEGTKRGFDIELIKAVHESVHIPVIASGGAGNVDHVEKLIQENSADAVCLASLFHYGIASPTELKKELLERGLHIRQVDGT